MACLLDVTRLVSRMGKGALTGIDRVELAYLTHLLRQPRPVFGLIRTPAGIILLPDRALAQVADWARGADLPQRSDWIGRISRRRDPVLAALEAALRRQALRRAPLRLAGPMLRHALPAGTAYLNVGHANLSAPMLRALRDGAGLRVAVLLHDTIPLDHPQFARPDQIAVFARRVAAIAAHADLVIHSAQATRRLNEGQLARMGRVPPGIVAPLGIELPQPDPALRPADMGLLSPYFVVLGTIEPRKNHSLLLDVWQELGREGGDIPDLLILGNRGWADPALFARLDRGVVGVRVMSGLGDGAVAALLAGARALLFPSHAEGFGLPALEAAALNVPVLATDLPVFREMLGNYPVYLKATEIYSWMRTIKTYCQSRPIDFATGPRPSLPSWSDHMETVLTSL